MRFCSRSRRVRTCRAATGVLCVVLLVHLLGILDLSGYPILDNGRREARVGVGTEEAELTSSSSYINTQVGLHAPTLSEGYGHSSGGSSWTAAATFTASATSNASVSSDPRSDLPLSSSAARRVLDPVRVKISPKHPVVLEGHAVRLVCVAMQTLRSNASSAPFLTFQLPVMENRDKRSVKLFLRPG